MLNLYRRHQPPCRYRSRRYRTCNCPIWVQGSLRGEYIRRGLDLRSWSAATDLVRDWEATGEIGVVKKPDIPTIAEAVDLFLQDARAQQLSPETIRKYENLLNRRLVPWCEAKGYRYLKQLGVEQMRQFRATWADGANYATKNLERLRGFFRFCLQDDWIAKNSARAVKAPRVADNPTLPFTDSEMQLILDACDHYAGNRVLVLRVLSRGVPHDIRGHAVLALWLDDKDLAAVDDEGPSSMCLMPWVLDHSRRWIDSWSPIDLVSGQQAHGAGAIEDPVVLGALKSLTNGANLAHSILGTTDRDDAVGTIRALRTAGHDLDPTRIRAWAVANGWGATLADELREIVEKTNEGRILRTREKRSYDRRSFEFWRQLGSSSDS